MKLQGKIKHNEKVCRAYDLGSYAQGQGRSQVRGQNLVSAITQKLLEQTRDLRGHLLHTVTFLVEFCFWPFLWNYGSCWLRPCSRNSCYIFERIDLNLCGTFRHDLKMCFWFWVFNCHIFDKVIAHFIFWHFSNFWTIWLRELVFGILLVFDLLIILIMVRMC